MPPREEELKRLFYHVYSNKLSLNTHFSYENHVSSFDKANLAWKCKKNSESQVVLFETVYFEKIRKTVQTIVFVVFSSKFKRVRATLSGPENNWNVQKFICTTGMI